MANRFNTFMDAWLIHKVWGLPLRMVFQCDWHRIHFAVIAVSVGLMIIGAATKNPPIVLVGKCIAAPSLLCLIMLPVLAILFIGLENLFADKTDQ